LTERKRAVRVRKNGGEEGGGANVRRIARER